MNKALLVVLLGISVLVLTGFILPFNKRPRDLTHYYRCPKCHCVYGPMHGKGPYQKIPSNKGNWCIHQWEVTTEDDFDQVAAR